MKRSIAIISLPNRTAFEMFLTAKLPSFSSRAQVTCGDDIEDQSWPNEICVEEKIRGTRPEKAPACPRLPYPDNAGRDGATWPWSTFASLRLSKATNSLTEGDWRTTLQM